MNCSSVDFESEMSQKCPYDIVDTKTYKKTKKNMKKKQIDVREILSSFIFYGHYWHTSLAKCHAYTYICIRIDQIGLGWACEVTLFNVWIVLRLSCNCPYIHISSARVALFKLVLYAVHSAHYIQCYQSVYFKQNANCIRNLLRVILFF